MLLFKSLNFNNNKLKKKRLWKIINFNDKIAYIFTVIVLGLEGMKKMVSVKTVRLEEVFPKDYAKT